MVSGNFGPGTPAMVLLSGLPGTGKTTFALALSRQHGFVHIESDAIRRALAPEPRYSAAESARVFALAHARLRTVLAAGGRAIVDATNLTTRDRGRFLEIAAQASATVLVIRMTAPDSTVRQRLRGPREGHSQAGEAVYERMRGRVQPFGIPVLVVDSRFATSPSVDLAVRLLGLEPAAAEGEQ